MVLQSFRLSRLTFLFLLLLFLSVCVGFGTAHAVTVSKMDYTSEGKPYLMVDNVIYNPLAVQYRVDKLVESVGKTLAESADYYPDAKSLGFNTMLIPLKWIHMETSQNVYDWTWLNSYIDNCYNNGLKLEILWFGTNVGYGAFSNVVPSYIMTNSSVYQPHIKSNGLVDDLIYSPTITGKSLSPIDTDTLNREKAALQAIMNHLASYDTHHTTIGIQIDNETRIGINEQDRSYDTASTADYNTSGFTTGVAYAEARYADYFNALAQVVKQSTYSVYTRMNFCCVSNSYMATIAQRANYIDYLGTDPYNNNISTVISSFNANSRLFSIAENGTYANSPTLSMASYNRGALEYGFYELITDVDAAAESAPDAKEYTLIKLDHSLQANTPQISNLVKQLGKEPYLGSYTYGKNILYFHVDDMNVSSSETKALSGIAIDFTTSNSGLGMAALSSNDLLLMSVGGSSSFIVHYAIPDSASVGYYDASHSWVSTGAASYTNNGNGTFTVNASSTQYIKLHYNTAISGITVTASNKSTQLDQSPYGAIDGTYDKMGYASAENPTLPQYFTLNYNQTQNFNGISISCQYCQGQGITNFDVQVSADGSTNWTTVASSGSLSYSFNNSTVETKNLAFVNSNLSKGIRLKINNANLTWGHYVINELTPSINGTVISGKSYRMIVKSSGKSVVVNNAGLTNGENVIQYDYGSTVHNDQWIITDVGGGYYKFINVLSGKAMVILNASLADGANVIQYDYGSAVENDKWQIISIGGGYYKIINKLSGKGLNVSGNSLVNGAQMIQWSYGTGYDNMRFQLVSLN